ncbi:MAG: tRNA (N6-threonylcarbamoyladenosine(37)-N6)-methyltransferase TrmO [Zetaproteobacteria bacterium]|nr:MAG: tRNA (N6-threonylcarbamoyladenosine(37)-N6)-methyltransferase TrmO [Zetaproteobacteria bacterium]
MGNKPPKQYTELFQQHAQQPVVCQPIGIVHSDYKERYAAPRQPTLGAPAPAVIELNPGMNFEQALKDLDGFSHLWVIYWMHLNRGWNPTVLPPRGPKIRRGLFATRAPHRPNRIGLSAVRLLAVQGRCLSIEGHDMLDGTPVLDIKPYLSYADAFPDASLGWAEALKP